MPRSFEFKHTETTRVIVPSLVDVLFDPCAKFRNVELSTVRLFQTVTITLGFLADYLRFKQWQAVITKQMKTRSTRLAKDCLRARLPKYQIWPGYM